MRMRAVMKCLLSVATLLVFASSIATVEAAGRASSTGRSSSSSSRSSGYSNSGAKRAPSPPAHAPAPAPGNSDPKSEGSTPPASSGYGNSATKPQTDPAAVPPKTPQSSLQKQKEKVVSKEQSAKALADYKTERSKFTTPESTVASSPATQSAVLGKIREGNQLPTTGSYYETRRSFYGGYGYNPPPYIYQSRPSFGMWDALALWFILDHFSNPRYSAMYYHHQDDPGIQEWRAEADRLAKDNADLKAKLAGLDENVASMSNTPKDPSYVPDDMKETVLAANVADRVLPEAAASDAASAKPAEKSKGSSHRLLHWTVGLGCVEGAIWLFRRLRKA